MFTSLSEHTAFLVNEALNFIQDEQNKSKLSPIHRLTIYKSLDEHAPELAHLTQSWLGILSTRFVYPFWKVGVSYPENTKEYLQLETEPQRMVFTAIELLRKRVDPKDTQLSHWYEVDTLTGLPPDSPYYREWCVFESGLRSLSQVTKPGYWQKILEELNISDEYIVSDYPSDSRGDAARSAIRAYEGGTWIPEEPDKWYFDSKLDVYVPYDFMTLDDWPLGHWNYDEPDTVSRRFDFWNWWLKEALPLAWELAQKK